MVQQSSEDKPTFSGYLIERHERVVAEKEAYIVRQIHLINRQRTLIEILLALHSEELPPEITTRLEEIEQLSA